MEPKSNAPLLPDGTPNLRKFAAIADYPVFVWINGLDKGYHMVEISRYAYGELPVPHFSLITVQFERPLTIAAHFDAQLAQSISVATYKRNEGFQSPLPLMFDSMSAAGGLVLHGDWLKLPSELEFMRDPMQHRVQWPQFVDLVSKQPKEHLEASSIWFEYYSWQGEASISLAYGETAEAQVVVVGMAVSPEEFRESLSALTPIQELDAGRIDSLQAELVDAHSQRYRPRGTNR